MNNTRTKMIPTALILFVAAFAIWALFKGALTWDGIGVTNITGAKAGQVLIAFVILATVLERAGQVLIRALHGDKEPKTRGKIRAINASLETVEAQPSMYGVFGAQALSKPQLDANLKAVKLKQDDLVSEKQRILEDKAENEKTEDMISLRATFPLALVLALVGIHFLEMLFGTGVVSELEGPQALAFHGADIVMTTLLLAGGATGLREILKLLKNLTDPKGSS